MKKLIMILLLSPSLILAQKQVEITHLPNTINTVGAELNFFRHEKTHAFFTAIREENNKFTSSIYLSEFQLDEWSEGEYFHEFNSDNFQSGNLFITSGQEAYFTFCFNEKCAIYTSKFKNKKWTPPKKLEERINQSPFTSTQPTIAEIDGEKFLYFVSDRDGGFGGTDIWVSSIDANGNFGNPVNCGKQINSKANEITPFFNKHDGMLYFSSDRENGMGGFDIYFSKGRLAFWESVNKLFPPYNTPFDEMYFIFFSENQGAFASNRTPALYIDKENCCNDIFTFETTQTEKQISNRFDNINENLPLSLYFDNDQPDCCTMNTKTNQTYKESYISYFLMHEEYLRNSNSTEKINDFFTNKLQTNFNKLDDVLLQIKSALNAGQNINLQIKGYASPLFESDYNINLSKRRIASLLNYMQEFQNGSITQYLNNGQLSITEIPFGELESAKNVNDSPNNKSASVYSIDAALARKIEIVRVRITE